MMRKKYPGSRRSGKRGFSLLESVLFVSIGFTLLYAGVMAAQEANFNRRVQERSRQIHMIANEIAALDRDLTMTGTKLHVIVKNDQLGLVPKNAIEKNLMISLQMEGDPNNPGAFTKVVYFNFQDKNSAQCMRLTKGMRLTPSGLYIGESSVIGRVAAIRCRTGTLGQGVSEIRVPYWNETYFLKIKNWDNAQP